MYTPGMLFGGAQPRWLCQGVACWLRDSDGVKNHRYQRCQKVYWVVVSNIFYFHPYLGKISNLTDIIQKGWNHQLGYLKVKIDGLPIPILVG